MRNIIMINISKWSIYIKLFNFFFINFGFNYNKTGDENDLEFEFCVWTQRDGHNIDVRFYVTGFNYDPGFHCKVFDKNG